MHLENITVTRVDVWASKHCKGEGGGGGGGGDEAGALEGSATWKPCTPNIDAVHVARLLRRFFVKTNGLWGWFDEEIPNVLALPTPHPQSD